MKIHNSIQCLSVSYKRRIMANLIILLTSLFFIQTLAQTSNLQAITESNAKFSRNFLKALNAAQGNLVTSPLSAQLALAMTQLGAGGNTASVMSSALHLPQDRTTSNEGFKQLTNVLQATNPESVKISFANRIYLSTGFDVKREFLNANKYAFNSEPQAVNFVHPNTRNFINQWVEHATQNKIQNLVQEGTLDSYTRLLLINTLYFNGKWAEVFSGGFKRPFYTSETNAIQVPMMAVESRFKFQQLPDLQASLLEIPYEGGKFSMVILLPSFNTGLAELEKKMQTQDLSSLINSASLTNLELSMPKFKIESTIDLKEPLTKMGMGNIFENTADFSGITTNTKLKVSKVLQKTIIEVAENGTVAASATYVEVVTKIGGLRRHIIDHPFLFYIVHRTTDSGHVVLFTGRVQQPQGYENNQQFY